MASTASPILLKSHQELSDQPIAELERLPRIDTVLIKKTRIERLEIDGACPVVAIRIRATNLRC